MNSLQSVAAISESDGDAARYLKRVSELVSAAAILPERCVSMSKASFRTFSAWFVLEVGAVFSLSFYLAVCAFFWFSFLCDRPGLIIMAGTVFTLSLSLFVLGLIIMAKMKMVAFCLVSFFVFLLFSFSQPLAIYLSYFASPSSFHIDTGLRPA